MANDLVAHSPVGFSSAERYINCPGSLALIQQLVVQPVDDPEYRADGVRAHALAAVCLREDVDPWQVLDRPEFELVDATMADSVQTYIDYVRSFPGTLVVETLLHRPELHEFAWGTVDASLASTTTIEIFDFKNGAGVTVNVERNPQLMGYAYLHVGPGGPGQYPDGDPVRLHIVQPNGFHPAGPCRSWETTVGEIRAYANEVLKPAIELALHPESGAWFDVGPWCQFCPAKIVCPVLDQATRMFARELVPELRDASDDRLADLYALIPAVRSRLRMVEAEVDRRNLEPGREPLRGTKVVHKLAHRVFKPGAAEALVKQLGAAVYTTPELKSPAAVEELGALAKALVGEWAYKPTTGYTSALLNDPRAAQTLATLAQQMAPVIDAEGATVALAPPEPEKPKRHRRTKAEMAAARAAGA
jgi:hypothetical protein